MLYLVQRARAEQREIRQDVHGVMAVTQAVQVGVARLDQRLESHEASDTREFRGLHEDIRDVRDLTVRHSTRQSPP
jgi:hypothetical protein